MMQFNFDQNPEFSDSEELWSCSYSPRPHFEDYCMSSRTGLRLQLMREQTMQNDTSQNTQFSSSAVSPAVSIVKCNEHTGGSSSAGSATTSFNSRTSPIIISQPIKFSGNKLVHLQPQIIHVQAQGEDGTRREFTVGSRSSPVCRPTRQRNSLSQSQIQGRSIDLSPTGYADSPPASFTSAHSELDDRNIIDEILAMEEEQRREGVVAGSFPSTGLLTDPQHSCPVPPSGLLTRQVSNSCPTHTTMDDLYEPPESPGDEDDHKDRRKKDIHNMIERRRRYNINDRIKELGTLLPKSHTEDLKLNKGTILKSSVDYIKLIRRRNEDYLKNSKALQLENVRLSDRVKELEAALNSSGAMPAMHTQICASPLSLTDSANQSLIKQEPPDEQLRASGSYRSPVSPTATAVNRLAHISLGGSLDTTEYYPTQQVHTYVGTDSDTLETPPTQQPFAQQPFVELMMDGQKQSPFVTSSDPMFNQPTPKTSPNVHWDSADFSPDNNNMDMS